MKTQRARGPRQDFFIPTAEPGLYVVAGLKDVVIICVVAGLKVVVITCVVAGLKDVVITCVVAGFKDVVTTCVVAGFKDVVITCVVAGFKDVVSIWRRVVVTTGRCVDGAAAHEWVGGEVTARYSSISLSVIH